MNDPNLFEIKKKFRFHIYVTFYSEISQGS